MIAAESPEWIPAELQRVLGRPLPFDPVEIATEHAPLLAFHEDEKYFPSTVAWYAARSELRLMTGGTLGHVVQQKPLKPADLYDRRHRGHVSTAPDPNRFQIRSAGPDAVKRAVRNGMPATAPAYCHLRWTPSGDAVDIQYWIFYPYSGNIAPPPLNMAHEGDWEHVTVRVDASTGKRREVFFAAHDEEGRWVEPGALTLDGGRLVAYVARSSHASYHTLDIPHRPGLPDDHVGDASRRDCRDVLFVSGVNALASQARSWLSFGGRWGRYGVFGFTSGPVGPAFKRSWFDDDERYGYGSILFKEGNDGLEDVVGEATDRPGQRIRLDRASGWSNDEARSLYLKSVAAGTVIDLFNDPEGKESEGRTRITVLEDMDQYLVRSFEVSETRGPVTVQRRGGGAVDGKVSLVVVDRDQAVYDRKRRARARRLKPRLT